VTKSSAVKSAKEMQAMSVGKLSKRGQIKDIYPKEDKRKFIQKIKNKPLRDFL